MRMKTDEVYAQAAPKLLKYSKPQLRFWPLDQVQYNWWDCWDFDQKHIICMRNDVDTKTKMKVDRRHLKLWAIHVANS